MGVVVTPDPSGKTSAGTDRTLIVARMDVADSAAVAEIFAASDSTELPHQVGVRRRELFRFHGLYFHLIDAGGDMPDRLAAVRGNRLFTEVNEQLARYVTAYDPSTWRAPADAMAQRFYSWSAD
jgi:cyclase